jgi:wyosine [tRNA(Phe)-imidazoG37] synthetase (radical SAM superfamily)
MIQYFKKIRSIHTVHVRNNIASSSHMMKMEVAKACLLFNCIRAKTDANRQSTFHTLLRPIEMRQEDGLDYNNDLAQWKGGESWRTEQL